MNIESSVKNLISVIICTYNRSTSLKTTLEGMLKQNSNGHFSYEVILVDNNSTDQTKECVLDLMKSSHNKLRYILETRQGVSFARNKGAQEAKGDIVVFTDDDVILSEDWLIQTWTCFQQNDCDAMGGRILPVYPDNTPPWIKDCADLLSGPIVRHDYGEETKIYQRPEMKPIVGASMAFKREVFQECGPFRTDIGVGKGTMGDDTEFHFRLERCNKKIYYCGKALVWHPVEKTRMNLRYFAKYKTACGRYLVLTNDESLASNTLVHYFGIPRYAIRQVIQAGFGLLFNFANKRKFIQLWLHLFTQIGIILEFREKYKRTYRSSQKTNIIQRVKTLIKILFCQVVYYTGVLHLFIKYIFLKRKNFSAIIINYHSFSSNNNGMIDPGPAVNLSPNKFRQTLDFITKYFHVISLDELVDHIQTGKNFNKPVVAITIDDGYLDNYVTMLPILKEKKIPATLFLASGFIGTKERIWVDRLLEALSKTKAHDLELQDHHDRIRIYDLSSSSKKYAAYNDLVGWLKGLPISERKDLLSNIERKLNYQPSEDRVMLNWSEIQDMEKEGVALGAHSVNHPILSRMPVEEAKREILESKQKIEHELGHDVKHFAVPNGRSEDFSNELEQYCREVGYKSVSSTTYGSNKRPEDCWHLKRICPCWPMGLFSVYLLRAFYKNGVR